MLTVAPDPPAGDDRLADGSSSLIDEIVREGARRMLAEARPTNTGSVKGMENQGMRRIRHLTGWIIVERVVIQRDIQNAGRWQVLLR